MSLPNIREDEIQPQEPIPRLESAEDPQSSQVLLKLQHILEAIYDAATKAQTNVQINNLHNLLWMFPENEDGVHIPRTIPVKIHNTITDVPIFTLINHKNLCIHELNIKTKLDISMEDIPDISEVVKGIKHKKYKMHVTKGQSDTTVEVCMKVEEPSEAYNRILNKLSQPCL